MKTKVCPCCQQEKEDIYFNKRADSKDGLSSYCKECNKENLKKHYNSNKKYYMDKSRAYAKSTYQWFNSYKETLCCKTCGEKRWWVLDFHHRDSSTKEATIAKMLVTCSREAILKEIDKCDVLCSNCHRDYHYQERLNKQK